VSLACASCCLPTLAPRALAQTGGGPSAGGPSARFAWKAERVRCGVQGIDALTQGAVRVGPERAVVAQNYCGNNPVNRVDPLGLDDQGAGGAVLIDRSYYWDPFPPRDGEAFDPSHVRVYPGRKASEVKDGFVSVGGRRYRIPEDAPPAGKQYKFNPGIGRWVAPDDPEADFRWEWIRGPSWDVVDDPTRSWEVEYGPFLSDKQRKAYEEFKKARKNLDKVGDDLMNWQSEVPGGYARWIAEQILTDLLLRNRIWKRFKSKTPLTGGPNKPEDVVGRPCPDLSSAWIETWEAWADYWRSLYGSEPPEDSGGF